MIDREFEKVYSQFVSENLIDLWELGYVEYWSVYRKDLGEVGYDYNTLFNNKVNEFLSNNKWKLKE